MSIKHILLKLPSRFWYIPSIYGLISVFFALISIYFNAYLMNFDSIHHILPNVLVTDIDLAQTILSTISASLLTMTAITFSTILVVLTTYLSEFSPRTIQDFVTDPYTKRVLGIFVGGFVYSILLLLLLRETDTITTFIVPFFAILFAIICLMVFVFFIHHVSSWIQVSNLIYNITLKTVEKIDEEYKGREEVHEAAPWENWENEEIKLMIPHQIRINRPGYIQHIHIEGIVEQASQDDCIVRIEKKINDYVDSDTLLLSLWTMNSKRKVLKHYEKFITTGTKQAPVNDIEFGLTKIVEIALRALSSGINDPNTAINCIDNLGKILTKMGGKYLPESFHHDANGNLRVIMDKPDFSDYLYKCFYQIRQSGFHDISVLSSGIQALSLIAERNSVQIKEIIWEFSKYIMEGIDQHSLLSLDKRYINRQLEALAKASGHDKEFEFFRL